MPYCPNCGKEVEDKVSFCSNCGYKLADKDQKEEVVKRVGGEEKLETAFGGPGAKIVDAMSALQGGVDIISAKPIVLLPAFIGSVISAAFSSVNLFFFGVIFSLIGGVISYIMTFASLDMSRNAYLDRKLDLGESVDYVIRRIWTFVFASIVGVILAITIILIPVVILMFVIMVVDESGLSASLSQAFKVLGNRLGDIIILMVIGMLGSFILGIIPFLGSILASILNVLIALAYIDIYFSSKRQRVA